MNGLACIIVDLQEPFLKGIPNRQDLQCRTEFLIKGCHLLEIPVLVTEQVPGKLGGSVPQIRDLTLQEQVYPKSSFSAWNAPGLTERLSSLGISHILLSGIETPICIYQTVLDARAQGMEVTMLSDCVSCRRKQDEPPILETLRSHGTYVLPSESVFYSILKSVEHPRFREFTRLVKEYSTS